jgi:hypothetical protein
MLQSSLANSLGLPYAALPPELLDAFSHDPAAVVGATRRYRGWRAVEDIQRRLLRQRDTFRAFLSVAADSGTFHTPGNVLDEPLTVLQQSLEVLESHRKNITSRAEEVAGVLTSVKAMHGSVKAHYNDTLSHASVVYPEVSCLLRELLWRS